MATQLKKGLTEFSAVMLVCGLLAYFNQYPPLEMLQDQFQEQKDQFFQNKYVTDLNDEDTFHEYTFDGNGELVKMWFSGCRTNKIKFRWQSNKNPDEDYRIKNVNCDLAYVLKDEEGKLHSLKRKIQLHKNNLRGWGFYEMSTYDNGKIYK